MSKQKNIIAENRIKGNHEVYMGQGSFKMGHIMFDLIGECVNLSDVPLY